MEGSLAPGYISGSSLPEKRSPTSCGDSRAYSYLSLYSSPSLARAPLAWWLGRSETTRQEAGSFISLCRCLSEALQGETTPLGLCGCITRRFWQRLCFKAALGTGFRWDPTGPLGPPSGPLGLREQCLRCKERKTEGWFASGFWVSLFFIFAGAAGECRRQYLKLPKTFSHHLGQRASLSCHLEV